QFGISVHDNAAPSSRIEGERVRPTEWMMTADIDVEPSAVQIPQVEFNDSILAGLRVRRLTERVKQSASCFADRKSGRCLEWQVPIQFDGPPKVKCHRTTHNYKLYRVARTRLDFTGNLWFPTWNDTNPLIDRASSTPLGFAASPH